jgi:hypothetical protein
VKSVYYDLARALGFEPDVAIDSAGVAVTDRSAMLWAINSAYEQAYTANEWEDAWADGTLTPSSGVIAFTDIGDGRRFTLWSEDPRPRTTAAYGITHRTSADGIEVVDDVATVFGLWLPKVARFTDAESEVDTILEVLAEPTVELAWGKMLSRQREFQAAAEHTERGLALLEDRAAIEAPRVAGYPWLQYQDHSG